MNQPRVNWNIAFWFLGLSTAVYLIPTGLALFFFYTSLTSSIDQELERFIASFGHAIDVMQGEPTFREWVRTVQTSPAHSKITYQLFDEHEILIEEHYPPGIPVLVKDRYEISSNGLAMRTRMTPLKKGNELVGYLQVQLPTKSRDEAVRQLAMITAIFAPLVLLGLSATSYLVAEKATKPIRKTLSLLRQFVADASHELYTPLSTVKAAVEILERQMNEPELEIIETTLERMEMMLEDLTLLSRMETPQIDWRKQKIDLSVMIADIVEQFSPKFKLKGVHLAVSIKSTNFIFGNHESLRRMIENIVENAWRYTDSGGTVTVLLECKSYEHCISIADTGIGIPAESLSLIFDRFYRIDYSRSRSSGGSGLGLAIAKAIAEAHGGGIKAISSLGKGTTFIIKLPRNLKQPG